MCVYIYIYKDMLMCLCILICKMLKKVSFWGYK